MMEASYLSLKGIEGLLEIWRENKVCVNSKVFLQRHCTIGNAFPQNGLSKCSVLDLESENSAPCLCFDNWSLHFQGNPASIASLPLAARGFLLAIIC